MNYSPFAIALRLGCLIPLWTTLAWAAPPTQETPPSAKPATSHSKTDPLVTVQRGTLPIVISAPHGGREAAPGVPVRENRSTEKFVTQRDDNTYEIATALADELERRFEGKVYRVFARFERKYLDVNRSAEHAYESPAAKFYYDAYHGTLAEFCGEVQQRWRGGLVLDIHGQTTYPDQLLVGTIGGKTVERLFKRHGSDALVGPQGLVTWFDTAGFNPLPRPGATDFNVPKYNGGYIVQTYGSSGNGALDAIQFEFGREQRTPRDKILPTARHTADVVEKFIRAYVSLQPAKGK